MDPTIWGPKLWFVIHTLALNYPQTPSYEDKRYTEDFFNNLKFLIPCDKCRIHYNERLNKNPIINYLDDTEKLFKYTVDLHNDVNKSLKKRQFSYNEAYKYYIDAYTKKKKIKINIKKSIKNGLGKIFSKKMIIIYIIIIVLILSYLYYRKQTFFRVIKV